MFATSYDPLPFGTGLFRLDTIPGIDPGPFDPGSDPAEEPDFEPEPAPDPDPSAPGTDLPGVDPGFPVPSIPGGPAPVFTSGIRSN